MADYMDHMVNIMQKEADGKNAPQANAWRQMQAIFTAYSDAMSRYSVALQEGWPPSNPAAQQFLGHVDNLATPLSNAVPVASDNAAAVDNISSSAKTALSSVEAARGRSNAITSRFNGISQPTDVDEITYMKQQNAAYQSANGALEGYKTDVAQTPMAAPPNYVPPLGRPSQSKWDAPPSTGTGSGSTGTSSSGGGGGSVTVPSPPPGSSSPGGGGHLVGVPIVAPPAPPLGTNPPPITSPPIHQPPPVTVPPGPFPTPPPPSPTSPPVKVPGGGPTEPIPGGPLPPVEPPVGRGVPPVVGPVPEVPAGRPSTPGASPRVIGGTPPIEEPGGLRPGGLSTPPIGGTGGIPSGGSRPGTSGTRSGVRPGALSEEPAGMRPGGLGTTPIGGAGGTPTGGSRPGGGRGGRAAGSLGEPGGVRGSAGAGRGSVPRPGNRANPQSSGVRGVLDEPTHGPGGAGGAGTGGNFAQPGRSGQRRRTGEDAIGHSIEGDELWTVPQGAPTVIEASDEPTDSDPGPAIGL
jgi:hypothetical protein